MMVYPRYIVILVYTFLTTGRTMETSKVLLNQYLSTDSNAKSIGSVTFEEMFLLSKYGKHLSKCEELL